VRGLQHEPHILWYRVKEDVQVTKEVFKAAGGRLKVVGRAGVGVDNVDLASATDMSLPTSDLLHSFCLHVLQRRQHVQAYLKGTHQFPLSPHP
jgi:hypothetical protein